MDFFVKASTRFTIIQTVDFVNERRLNSAPKNVLFSSSRLPHKYDSYTGTIHKADITGKDCLKV